MAEFFRVHEKCCLSLFLGLPGENLGMALGQPGLEPKKFSHITMKRNKKIF